MRKPEQGFAVMLRSYDGRLHGDLYGVFDSQREALEYLDAAASMLLRLTDDFQLTLEPTNTDLYQRDPDSFPDSTIYHYEK